jgi:hypothetical protein
VRGSGNFPGKPWAVFVSLGIRGARNETIVMLDPEAVQATGADTIGEA